MSASGGGPDGATGSPPLFKSGEAIARLQGHGYTAYFALIALVAWKYLSDSALRNLVDVLDILQFFCSGAGRGSPACGHCGHCDFAMRFLCR